MSISHASGCRQVTRPSVLTRDTRRHARGHRARRAAAVLVRGRAALPRRPLPRRGRDRLSRCSSARCRSSGRASGARSRSRRPSAGRARATRSSSSRARSPTAATASTTSSRGPSAAACWSASRGGCRARAASVGLLLREGFVDEEFIDLARAERDAAQEARLTELKRALAERVLARRRRRRWSSSARADDRVDRDRAARERDRHAVVAVADRVAVAGGDDGDRRQHGAARLGEPDALPALARARRRPEGRVELLRAVGLERAGDRSSGISRTPRGAAPPGRAARRPARRSQAVRSRAGGAGTAARGEAPRAGPRGRTPSRASVCSHGAHGRRSARRARPPASGTRLADRGCGPVRRS